MTSSSKNQENSTQNEISLIDIHIFFKRAWRLLIIFGLSGIAISLAFIVLSPKQYEASVKITMAQIGVKVNMAQIGVKNNNEINLNSSLVNIEEPQLVITRFSSPTSFTKQIIEACGLQDQVNAALKLSKSIRLTIPKGVANLVELKTFGPSPQVAQACAQSLFDQIKISQAQIVAPYIDDLKGKLAEDEERLVRAKSLLARADKSGQAMSATYLSTRDEIRFSSDEITALKNVVSLSRNRATSLVAPIYAADTPIAPQKFMALTAGLLGGLFVGLLMALVRQMTAKLKSEMTGRNDV